MPPFLTTRAGGTTTATPFPPRPRAPARARLAAAAALAAALGLTSCAPGRSDGRPDIHSEDRGGSGAGVGPTSEHSGPAGSGVAPAAAGGVPSDIADRMAAAGFTFSAALNTGKLTPTARTAAGVSLGWKAVAGADDYLLLRWDFAKRAWTTDLSQWVLAKTNSHADSGRTAGKALRYVLLPLDRDASTYGFSAGALDTAPLSPAAAPAVGSALSAKLQAALEAALVEGGEAGGVAHLRSPAGVWRGAAGYADAAARTRMSADDTLRLASISKTFLATLVLRLEAAGALSLDDTIGDYLSGEAATRVPNADTATLRHLLGMVSGIPNYTDLDSYEDAVAAAPSRAAPYAAEDAIEFVYDLPPNFKPGEAYEYSNTNYLLLEVAARVAGGRELGEQLRDMLDTVGAGNTWQELRESRSGGFNGLTSRGYEEGRDVTAVNDYLGLGDGGLVSDAHGVAAFADALLRDKTLLAAGQLAKMKSLNAGGDYGLGLYPEETDLGDCWVHNGASAGFGGDMAYCEEEGVTLVVLANEFGSDLFDRFAARVADLL